MDTPADPELEAWAGKWRVGDLLPILIRNGFTYLEAVLSITSEDLVEIGMTKVGDRRRIELALKKSNASQAPTPALPLSSTLQPPIARSAPTSPLAPGPPSPPGLAVSSTRTQKRCRKNCHLFRGRGHRCTAEDKCPGYHACQQLDLHPEEKQRQRAAATAERKRKRAEEKEEENELKKRKDELLRLQKQPEFEDWWRPRLAEIIAADPEKYSMEEGSKGRALAMIVVAQEHTRCRRDIKIQAAINKKITAELKANNLSIECSINACFIKDLIFESIRFKSITLY
jgi:hypothetical protein